MDNFLQCVYEERFEEAIESLPKIYEQTSYNINFIACAYQNLQQYEKALEMCQIITTFKEDDIIILTRIGRILNESKKTDEAKHLFQKSLEQQAQTSFELKCQADSLYFLDRIDDCALRYTDAINLDPQNMFALYGLGYVQQERKNYKESIDLFNSSLQINARFMSPLLAKGISLLRLKNYEEAIQVFTFSIQVNPKSYHSYYQKAIALRDQNKHNEAIQNFEISFEIKNKLVSEPLSQIASIYYGQDKYQQAITYYDKVLELNPSNVTANYNKGLSYKQMEKYQEAIPFLDKANQLNPKHTSSMVTKALCLQELNRHQEALKVLEEVDKINPKEEFHNSKIAFIYFDLNEYDKAIYYFQLQIKIKEYASDYRCLADISFKRDQYQEAMKYLNKSLEIDPNLIDSISRKILVFKKLKQVKEAKEFIQVYINKAPNNHQYILQLGVIYREEEQNQQALQCFDQAIKIDPKYIFGYYQKGIKLKLNLLGTLLKEMEQYTEAIKTLDICLQSDPKHFNAWLEKGRVYREQKMYDKALECVEKSFEIKPNNDSGVLLKGLIKYDSEKYEEAIIFFQKYNDLNKNSISNPDTPRLIANSYRFAGKIQQSLQLFEQIIKQFPKSHMILNDYGSLLNEIGRKQEAVGLYQKAISLKPDYTEALYNKGVAYYQMGNNDQAFISYQECLKVNPNYKNALNNLGLIYYQRSQQQQALELYDRALKQDPNYVDGLINRGNSLKDMKQIEKSLNDYERAIQLSPNNSLPYFNKALILQEQKKIKEAIQHLEKAVSLTPGNPLYHIMLSKAYNNNKQSQKAFQSLKNAQQAMKGDLTLYPFRKNQYDYMNRELPILEKMFKDFESIEVMMPKATPQVQRKYQEITVKKETVLLKQPKTQKEEDQQINDINSILRELNQLRQEMGEQKQQITKLQEDVREIQDFLEDQMQIKKQLQSFREDSNGFKYHAYYKGYYWTISNYMNTYYQLSTGLIQVNYNTLIETNLEKNAEKAIKLSKFGQSLTDGIPFIGTAFQVVEKALQMLLDRQLGQRFEDRKNAIVQIIQQKCDRKDELETTLAKAALKVTDFRKENILLLDIQEKEDSMITDYFKLTFEKFKSSDNQAFQTKYSLYGVQEASQTLAYFYKYSQQICSTFLTLDDKILEIFQLQQLIKPGGKTIRQDIVEREKDGGGCKCVIQ
ncbi:hypothetical protein pb186bvf_002426 [Paramecium bursaria]